VLCEKVSLLTNLTNKIIKIIANVKNVFRYRRSLKYKNFIALYKNGGYHKNLA